MNYVKWLEDDIRLPLDFIISIKEKNSHPEKTISRKGAKAQSGEYRSRSKLIMANRIQMVYRYSLIKFMFLQSTLVNGEW